MIIIDNITSIKVTGSPINFNHTVSHQDAILLILHPAGSIGGPIMQYNGVFLTQLLPTATEANNNSARIYYMINPPVGNYPVNITNGGGSLGVVVMTILGVNKKTTNFTYTSVSTQGAANPNLSVTPSKAGSMIIDLLSGSFSSGHITPAIPGDGQIQIADTSGAANGTDDFAASFKIAGPGQTQMAWTINTLSGAWCQVAVVLEPNDAPSIWHPSITTRNNNDITGPNGLNIPVDQGAGVLHPSGYYASNFWQNSFLHTIGRIIDPTQAINNPAGNIPVTSQIVIDKVYQAQIGGGAVLSIQVDIPSSDAVLVVSGGSVIATGGAWIDVNLDGTKLTNLAVATVVGADAEIWWLPNPPVGSHTLTITPTAVTGQVYANAAILLGVDKRANIVSSSVTDAASAAVITASITPDASNVLIIDAFGSLDATQRPTFDASQIQMLNSTSINASEYVMSTYKLASNSLQQMTYQLGASVNAALVVAAFRPNQSPSFWFPNIDNRNLNDVVSSTALDAGISPTVGNYGYKGSNFFLNSFLHTVGRYSQAAPSTGGGNDWPTFQSRGFWNPRFSG